MAEILLSLTIIGVVAAITLPALTGNINERTWDTQRKALYARMSQAISLMPAINGYGTVKEATASASGVDTAAETFVTDGLSKVLKINNICDSEHLSDCGIPSKIIPIKGENIKLSEILTLTDYNSAFSYSSYPYSYSQQNTHAVAFETVNGESVLTYYNPNCSDYLSDAAMNYVQRRMCANFIYDLNGNKGPNTVGKDIGYISVFYPTDPELSMPTPVDNLVNSFGENLQSKGSKFCKARAENSRLPNIDELSASFYNRRLLGVNAGAFWSSTRASSDKYYALDFSKGFIITEGNNHSYHYFCVR